MKMSSAAHNTVEWDGTESVGECWWNLAMLAVGLCAHLPLWPAQTANVWSYEASPVQALH